MRMWMVNPELLCRQHLLGEHVETHMFVGSIRREHSMAGFVRNGLLESASLTARHDALAAEMVRRGYRHHSPMDYRDEIDLGRVDPENSERELRTRCPECAQRQQERR